MKNKFSRSFNMAMGAGANFSSKLKLFILSFRIPIWNRLGIKNKSYTAILGNKKVKTNVQFEGSYDELLVLEEIFGKKSYNLSNLLKEKDPQNIIDIGANIGLASIFFASRYPKAKVRAYEANPYIFERLKENLKGLKGVSVFNRAVTGGGTREISFFVDHKKNIGSSTYRRKEGQEEVKVKTINLEDVCRELSGKIDILKIDVEGGEFDIFENIKDFSNFEAIVGEFHEDIAGKPADTIIEKIKMTHQLEFRDSGHEYRKVFCAIKKNELPKINLLFLIPSFMYGGLEMHLLKQLKHFDKERFSFSILTLFDYKDRRNLKSLIPIFVSISTVGNFKLLSFSSWKKLIEKIKKENPHIVVSSMFSGNFVSRALSSFLGFVSIAREHNTYEDKNIFHKICDFLLSFISYKVVAVSGDVKKFASKQAFISLSRFEVIPNGIDNEAIHQEEKKIRSDGGLKKQNFGISEHQKIVLNVARLKPQKNQLNLIKAFEQLYNRFPEYVLCIVGDGSERKKLEDYVATRNISGFVKILGFRSDVSSLYILSDVFVLPSRREGFPNVVLESMAFSLPVIATPVAGVREIVNKENGIICSKDESGIFAALIEWCNIHEEKKEQMRKEARKSAETFDIKKNVSLYESLFIKAYESKFKK